MKKFKTNSQRAYNVQVLGKKKILCNLIVCLLLACLWLGFGTGCKKFLEIPPAPNQLLTTSIFLDSTNATATVLGMYTNMASPSVNQVLFGNGAVSIYTGLSGDELYPGRNIPAEKQVYVNNIPALQNSVITAWLSWSSFYRLIYEANSCIEGISSSSKLSNSLKAQLVGESKVMRAFAYFNLVNLYGGVPLSLTTNYKVTDVLPRASVDNVYGQIIKDLLDAENQLSVNYPTSGHARINKYVAEALLAKVYLYTSNWGAAEQYSSIVINSGIFSLESDLNNVFLAGSKEAIWQMPACVPGYETSEAAVIIPTDTTVLPNYVISDEQLSAFEIGDLRKQKWLNSNTINSQEYYYPYKYKLLQDNSINSLEDYMVFRLGEQYLIRAEARINLNEIAEGVADLNVIRSRARAEPSLSTPNPLPPISPNLTQTDAIKAVAHERQTELFCEWGNRWFDLKRTGQINAVMSVVTPKKGGIWKTDDQLYPIDQVQLQSNPFLIQNPGY